MKNINGGNTQEIEPPLEEEDEIETIVPVPTINSTELMENWNTINLIEREFKYIKNAEINNITPQEHHKHHHAASSKSKQQKI